MGVNNRHYGMKCCLYAILLRAKSKGQFAIEWKSVIWYDNEGDEFEMIHGVNKHSASNRVDREFYNQFSCFVHFYSGMVACSCSR